MFWRAKSRLDEDADRAHIPVEDAAPGPVVPGYAEKSSRALQPPERGKRFRVRHSAFPATPRGRS